MQALIFTFGDADNVELFGDSLACVLLHSFGCAFFVCIIL